MRDVGDPWKGLVPHQPPGALRARVLAAARAAARHPQAGLLAELYRDRLLRLCAAGVLTLLILNALALDRGFARDPAPRLTDAGDGVLVPADTGMTASEQVMALAKES